MVTHSVRSAIVSSLLGKTGLKATEDSVQELKPSRIERDNADLTKLIEGIESTMNPFLPQFDDANLYSYLQDASCQRISQMTYCLLKRREKNG